MNDSPYKLSPSDFRYLWEDCKHCFYLKVKKGINQPSIGIPGVFMKMNSLLQKDIEGVNLKDINPNLPSGVIETKEEKVQKFTHQLHAYKFALENPQEGEKKNVSKMGLVIVAPEQIGFKNGFVYFKSTPQWFEIKEDMDGFLNFIENVNEVLNSEPPQPTPECKWCIYRTYFEPKEDIHSDELPF